MSNVNSWARVPTSRDEIFLAHRVPETGDSAVTKVPLSKAQLKDAAKNGKLVIQIKTTGDGGVAVYGKSFGRYPLDPSLVLKKK